MWLLLVMMMMMKDGCEDDSEGGIVIPGVCCDDGNEKGDGQNSQKVKDAILRLSIFEFNSAP